MKSRLAFASFIILLIFLIFNFLLFLPFLNQIGGLVFYLRGVGFIFSLPVAIAGVILSAVSIILVYKKKLEGKWYAIAGIVIDIVLLTFWRHVLKSVV